MKCELMNLDDDDIFNENQSVYTQPFVEYHDVNRNIEKELKIFFGGTIDLESIYSNKMDLPNYGNVFIPVFSLPSFIFTDSIIENKSPRQLKFEFPSEIKSFIQNNNMPDYTISKIDDLVQSVDNLLHDKKLQSTINLNLFTDSENDWQEIQLTIAIKNDLKFIYDNIRPSIYKFINEIIPEEISDKILIKFETL